MTDKKLYILVKHTGMTYVKKKNNVVLANNTVKSQLRFRYLFTFVIKINHL